MNRRNFFKVITGFVAGVFLSKAQAEPTVYSLWSEGKSIPAEVLESEGLNTGSKRSGTRLATEKEIMDYLEMDFYGNYPAYIERPEGVEFIHYKRFFKTKI